MDGTLGAIKLNYLEVLMSDQTPHNLDAEMGILGCMLSENSVLDLITDQVAATDFYDPVNARIFDAIKDIITSGRLADGVTLHAKFKADDALKDIGGAGYLATLVEAACDPIAVVDYSKLTRDLSKRRLLIRAGQSLISKASVEHDAESSAETILSQHEADLSMIALTGAKSTAGYAGTLATLRLKDLRSPKPGGVRVKTGIADLDETLGFLSAGDLWVVGARPAMGKTAISLTVALNVARQGYGVIIFCLDMTAAAMMDRFLSMMVKGKRIEYRDIGRNRVRDGDQHLLDEAAAELATLPIIIDDRRGRTADDILSATRRHKEILKRKGVTLGLSIIDHLQKIKASRTRANDYSEMNDTIRRIKNDAMSIGAAIMLCSQLSRGVEQRDDKRPKMSDLRDSGAIEEEADMISLLYRDAYYLFEGKPEGGDKLEQWQRKLEESKDRLEVISPKVRQGDRGRVTLFCDIGINRIASLGHGDLDF
jgi:replicative DNA helicase